MRTCTRTHLSTNVRSRQAKDFNYIRTQVKIAKDEFDLCPDISQNKDYLCPIVPSWIVDPRKEQNTVDSKISDPEKTAKVHVP